MIKFSDALNDPWFGRGGRYIHKDGADGRYWNEGDMICHHENIETIEECEGSPYFINHCPNCGFFESVKRDQINALKTFKERWLKDDILS